MGSVPFGGLFICLLMNKKGGCTMRKIAIVSILTLSCVLTCAFVAGTVSAQEGWEKTLTLPSGEKVLDMR
jgi:hypothetical protein